MRTKKDLGANYGSIFTGHLTLRRRLNRAKPFLRLSHPEVEDVAINNRCMGGCPYCYVSACPTGEDFPGICEKAKEVWGGLLEEDRPYQIAIGGAGEPTLHPDLLRFCETARSLSIIPNLTTNGMHLNAELIKGIGDLCGGVAVSYHKHLVKHFQRAVETLCSAGVSTSIHVILGEPGSGEDVIFMMDRYPAVNRIVILPYQGIGRAGPIDPRTEWDRLFNDVQSLWNMAKSKVAFGAGFYDYFLHKCSSGPEEGPGIGLLDLDLYNPELFSGYRIMDVSHRILRKSSFNPVPV